jgi:hypothetical protein
MKVKEVMLKLKNAPLKTSFTAYEFMQTNESTCMMRAMVHRAIFVVSINAIE